MANNCALCYFLCLLLLLLLLLATKAAHRAIKPPQP